jgi:protein MpaA
MSTRSTRTTTLALSFLLLLGALVSTESAQARDSRPGVITETRQIGQSVKGRPILAHRIGDPEAPVKAVVLAAIHGNEPGPIRIIRNLLRGRQVQGVDLWVVPTLNPDGLKARNRRNARGVDLNRNFPTDWGKSYGNTYSGPRPMSEPETTAFMAFLDEINPKYVVSFHQPLRGVGVADSKPKGFQRALAKGLRLKLKAFNCTGVCHGTMTTWFNRNHEGTAITVEYGHRLSRKQANRTGPNGVLRALGGWR